MADDTLNSARLTIGELLLIVAIVFTLTMYIYNKLPIIQAAVALV